MKENIYIYRYLVKSRKTEALESVLMSTMMKNETGGQKIKHLTRHDSNPFPNTDNTATHFANREINSQNAAKKNVPASPLSSRNQNLSTCIASFDSMTNALPAPKKHIKTQILWPGTFTHYGSFPVTTIFAKSTHKGWRGPNQELNPQESFVWHAVWRFECNELRHFVHSELLSQCTGAGPMHES